MNAILGDDIGEVEAETYLMTHTTNPLLSTNTIKKAIGQFLGQSNKDSLFSVNKWQTRLYSGNGLPINHDPGNLLRTQDLEPLYEENSCLYLFSRDSFARTGARIGLTPMLFETPKHESIDIDDQEDWLLARCLLEQIKFVEE